MREWQEIVVDNNSSLEAAPRAKARTEKRRRAEKRKEPRYAASGTVTFRLVLGESSYQTGELRNVSRSELNLCSSRMLPIGSLVEVRLSGCSILGDVRYCRRLKAARFETSIWIAAANATADQLPDTGAEEPAETRAA